MLRVVLDTNVILSAIVFGGNPERILELARLREIIVLTSTSILLELASVLKAKFLWEEDDVTDAIRTIGYRSELIKPELKLDVLADDGDNRILECAVESKADFIISGDHHLLQLREYELIRIMSPSEFLEEFGDPCGC